MDQTVLANEQVLPDGTSERSGAMVVKKKLAQWYFKITDYADRLLDDLNQLEGSWPPKVLAMQRNWIGRSIGADVHFEIEGHDEKVTVFTTRPDTLYGVTFMVVAPDSDLAAELAAGSTPEVQEAFAEYLAQAQKNTEIERQDATREKTGVSLGRFALNPVTGERIPVWTADYVLADYGHGAVMAVPAHDQRDLDFARKFDLPVRVVLDVNAPVTGAIPVLELDENGQAILPDDLAARPGRDGYRPGRRRPDDQLGPPRRPEQEQRDQEDHRAARGRRNRSRRQDLPLARLAHQPPTLLGHAHPDHPRLRR